MFPPGPCGYASSAVAPDWFLLDASPESKKRILGMLMENGEGFCDSTIGSIRRGPRGGDGAWMLEGRYCCAVNIDENNNPTLLDLIQRHFLPDSRVTLSSGGGAATTYPPLNHRVAVYRYTNQGPANDNNNNTTDQEGSGGGGGGGGAHGGLVEVTDIISLSDITRFLMRWNHIEHCLTPCTVKDLGVGSRDELAFPSTLHTSLTRKQNYTA